MTITLFSNFQMFTFFNCESIILQGEVTPRAFSYRMHLSFTLNLRELIGKRGQTFSVGDQIIRIGNRFFFSTRSTFSENFNYFAVSCAEYIKKFYHPASRHTV